MKSGAGVPVPLKLPVCGVPAALSLMLKVPEREPVAVGVNVTLMLQLVPAANATPQLLLCAKSPLAVMLLIVSGPVPVLLSVAVCGAPAAPTN